MSPPRACKSTQRPSSIRDMQSKIQKYVNNMDEFMNLWNSLVAAGGTSRLNPYLLGAGSFGAVFALPDYPCVAMKVVHFKGAYWKAELKSFNNEVSKASIGSPYYETFIKKYSIPILGSIRLMNRGLGVYFMPNMTWYGDNVVPLEGWIKAHPNMSDPEYTTIFKQLRDALIAMYNSGLVHGDLHTANIHVVYEDSGEITKVLIGDLGTAIGIEDAQSNSRRTAIKKLKTQTTLEKALNSAHEVWASTTNTVTSTWPVGSGIGVRGDPYQRQSNRSNLEMLMLLNPGDALHGVRTHPRPNGKTLYGVLTALPKNTGKNINKDLVRKSVDIATRKYLSMASDGFNTRLNWVGVGNVNVNTVLNYTRREMESFVPEKNKLDILKTVKQYLDSIKKYIINVMIRLQKLIDAKSEHGANNITQNNMNSAITTAFGRVNGVDKESHKLLKGIIIKFANEYTKSLSNSYKSNLEKAVTSYLVQLTSGNPINVNSIVNTSIDTHTPGSQKNKIKTVIHERLGGLIKAIHRSVTQKRWNVRIKPNRQNNFNLFNVSTGRPISFDLSLATGLITTTEQVNLLKKYVVSVRRSMNV